ncbi:hypothetical protein [Clostridium paraputrificum]|uniref:Uncharacterized protein n=1 Tax=Clostridium paraputrificum TaxID=29363 RepID=A0A1B8RST2_9CLOT|nr:hypothetical protein [Clostridium paraputrificum]OBY11891.1 hypothetical protein CP373A1_02925 [Clostridium paraputrificum]
MYTNLILYRNELKNKGVPKYKILGIVSELLYSKKIFCKNSEIKKFVEDVFGIEFKEYIMKSRTMIVARISKMIFNSEENDEYRRKLIQFINMKIELIKKDENVKEKKNEFDGWLK